VRSLNVDVNQNGLRGRAHHRQFGMLGRIGNSGNTDKVVLQNELRIQEFLARPFSAAR